MAPNTRFGNLEDSPRSVPIPPLWILVVCLLPKDVIARFASGEESSPKPDAISSPENKLHSQPVSHSR